MLVLTRRTGEEIVINEHIRLIVQKIKGNRVRICIDAPREINVRRGELAERPSELPEPVGS